MYHYSGSLQKILQVFLLKIRAVSIIYSTTSNLVSLFNSIVLVASVGESLLAWLDSFSLSARNLFNISIIIHKGTPLSFNIFHKSISVNFGLVCFTSVSDDRISNFIATSLASFFPEKKGSL
ncbi:hypothetical protein II5_05950 [Bacillus cereus MSX-A1]|nr:hypothetical protein II5_05950 [Bacillus cereus MSX-A1]